ncbi:hypothetical protein PVAND_007033 [Polypedilum vanderplanki]|uniref:Zinc carboxypeptidase A 1 n=1 Tax=Polypedilum vanderplanki TaxID=319348 RepID=A0A9J6C6M8_POLVA|nr:hypothetical protein PVAND_007033 [Polypedilum vanderplanki]
MMKILQHSVMMMFMPIIIVQCEESIYTYKGCKVYDVTPMTEDDVNFLHSLTENENFDFWSLRRNVGIISTVLVKPNQQDWFENSLNEKKIPFMVKIEDLEKVLNNERQSQLYTRNSRSSNSDGTLTFDRYYRHDEINKYLDNLAALHENFAVRTIGKSYEGRKIKAIKLTNGDGSENKNSIYIDAGTHAREWISVATALYLIEQLTTGDSLNILNNVDVIIQPVVNPDGYEYSHKFERLWRKTRSRSSAFQCIGCDPNRNFDYHWGEVGASNNQCSETYRGQTPFSEKETIALRDAVKEVKDSYLPETWKEIDEIAQIGANAIANATGTKYTIGSSTNVLYAAAGGSDDYFFAVDNIPISITMELPGGGFFGFDMPASKIEETVKESSIGIFAMIQAVSDKYK